MTATTGPAGVPAEEEFDVVVVGGGPAGSMTAGLLAKRGRRVLVLEREKFPRYHIGESLITGMLSVIEELGLTERLEAMNFPRKYGVSLVWGRDKALWNVRFAEAGPYEYSFHVRRAEYDQLLLTRARELGAVVVEQATVKEPLVDGDRVAGVAYTVAGDDVVRFARARIVVDASGQARTVSRHFTRPAWDDDLRNIANWTYYRGCGALPEGQVGNILVEQVPDGWVWAIPVDDGVLSVGYVTSTEKYTAAGLPGPQLFHAKVAQSQELRKLLDGAELADEFRTTRDWSYIAEDFHGPGWVSVGDAAAFIDPLFSTGVWLATMASWVLDRSIDELLEAPEHEERALARYARVYGQLVTDIRTYVKFFYNPERDREDYFARAQALQTEVYGVGEPRVAFVATISGIAALQGMLRAIEEEERVGVA